MHIRIATAAMLLGLGLVGCSSAPTPTDPSPASQQGRPALNATERASVFVPMADKQAEDVSEADAQIVRELCLDAAGADSQERSAPVPAQLVVSDAEDPAMVPTDQEHVPAVVVEDQIQRWIMQVHQPQSEPDVSTDCVAFRQDQDTRVLLQYGWSGPLRG